LVERLTFFYIKFKKIGKEIFSFPGGRRFHFEDLTGNEYAVWTDIL